ncbi:mechanosensitive ion channel family protein [Aliiglaciecola sp. 3_MG-2023]|uniref:mechanosensitive ion channel family protein n=1 Tax=Aliiglaciecola sp. 3_MG-2023 TaxID=3062644 RepID=UPI0026E1F8C9|nr:mechanosensitive ion channel family protein [Aliiglaciecola sp. 3_MG-2023]MDO6692165.1 mechanosensitive ion channel family protein [Aliiglaciecola sp. 3_MG-2023]
MLKQEKVKDWLLTNLNSIDAGITEHSWLYQGSAILLSIGLATIAFMLTRLLMRGRISQIVSLSRNNWDDELHKHGFFRRICHIVPALVMFLLTPVLLDDSNIFYTFIQKSMLIYIAISVVWSSSALFNTVEDIYNASELAKRAPITGFIQVAKLVVVIVAALLIISNLLDKSPLLLLSGLGAVTAVLLLLFRDTILGFVAGIQIAANRMVNNGDWIELQKYGADGEVLEVGLTTVKVQNWDKTISTIPTYTLISDSVKNWRGMSESGGRRIKRAIQIDINSIEFCDADTLAEYKKIRYISDYIESKIQLLRDYHNQQHIDEQDLLNSRRLTNIGTYRAYVNAYLQHHMQLNKEMTMMVRQLPPTETGLPLEIYCFCADKNWVNYEGVQADIFDHCLAMLPVFNLRAYQRVSDRA